ncbi:MAG TPA: WYL domain-containing protein, partial [Spirochaetia bacterium]|nr:WYL domain-containing protein [Spirochaetia bacterium]
RLFSSRTDKPSPHACSAVRKLGNCLKPYSERLSGFLLTTASGIERRVSSQDNQYVSVLEKLTRAWSDGVWVKLDYFSKKSGEIHCYHFAPWFIQPYPAGFTVYVIGFCREKNHRITLKVERIRDVELLKEQYDIPDSFNPEELFQDAWGIWYGDGDPVDVILKFSSGVADRVTETIWHKSQEIVRAATGEVTFRASVAEPLEMVPWIRGWGSDCEVIAPRNLRDFMREEIRKLEGLYSDRPTIQREGLGG